MENRLMQADAYLRQVTADRKIPGAVIAVGHREELLMLEAYGYAQWEPEELPMTRDTVFDLASLSKVTATWPCIAQLLDRQVLTLDMKLAQLLKRPVPAEMENITLFHLLTHTAGLREDEDLDSFGETRSERIQGALTFPLGWPVGEGVHYSDLGFILLGEIVEIHSGIPLDQAAARIWSSLGMKSTCFCPSSDTYCAATEKVNGVVTRGIVHDERAQQLFGVAGHAGVFSTAADLARYCAALLPGSGEKICSDEWLRRSFALHAPDARWDRGLAWVVHLENAEGNFVGHTGFTGTTLWIDTATGDYCVLLSNRVHPTRENPHMMEIRKEIRQILFEK